MWGDVTRDKRITYQSLGLDKNKALRDEVLYFLAGVEGLEPSQTVLETGVLPLTPYPYIARLVGHHGLEPRTDRL